LGELSSLSAASSLSPFSADCITSTSGYDFRKGQVARSEGNDQIAMDRRQGASDDQPGISSARKRHYKISTCIK
jgi:hypothetical protein